MEGARFSPRPQSQNKDVCAVKGCESKAKKNLDLRFHKFPQKNQHHVNLENLFGNTDKIELFKAWSLQTKITNVTKKTKVCSLHFNKSDYILPDAQSQKRYLKKDAFPSCNLPSKTSKPVNAETSEARLKRRLTREEKNPKIKKKKTSETEEKSVGVSFYPSSIDLDDQMLCDEQEMNLSDGTDCIDCVETVMQEIDEELSIAQSSVTATESDHNYADAQCQLGPLVEETNPSMRLSRSKQKQSMVSVSVQVDTSELCPKSDASVQVKSGDLMRSFCDTLNTRRKLSTATGIESFEVLDTMVELLNLYTARRYENINLLMNTRERIILTFMKMKQNFTYEYLAIMFNCYSARHCQRIFIKTVKLLSVILEAALPWPSREEISRSMPQCFEGFEDVRIVLDCTEIYIQQPCNLCCQKHAYSHYKGTYTGKFMTGVCPCGNIIYISPLYGGKASDTEIFNQSDLKNLLEPGDAVMVAKGFHIDEACHKNGWKLIRPPFKKRGKSQFTESECDLSANISSARVHVERSYQRIKAFSILGTKYPAALLKILPEIFTVIFATINMSSPILKDDKFMVPQGCLPEGK